MVDVVIRPLMAMADIKEAEMIQRQAWSMDDLDIIPAHLMHATQHNGAVLLGAYDDGQMVGFTFGVIGTVEGLSDRIDQVAAARLQIYSVITGVLPSHQESSVGLQLKLAQRDFAMRIGIRLITWTFDPLESRNGRFNIGKLGTICHHYIRDFHGHLGGLNAGLATDRFHVEWWVTSNRVQSRSASQRRPLQLGALLGGGAVLVNEATFDENGQPGPPLDFLESGGQILLVEIPANFQAIKRQDPSLAQRWRAHGRYLFEFYFQHDFMVTDFSRHVDELGREHSYYVLTHRDA